APVVANSVPAEGNPGQAAVPANQASAIGDFGPSYFAGNESAASTNGSVSLAEMATQYKSQAARSSHTYTNADIEQIAGKNSGIVLTNNTRTISLPSGEASGNAQTAQNTRPNPQSAAPQTPGQSATQPGAAVSQENPNSATTPRINQPQPGTREGETRTLPATATLLPLLGLIGVLTGGLGLLFRRSSR
ncbi:MAG TPA: hypothetical protein VKT33_12390, partial [Candidatus Angelobacter sp.]|nr:hypothetical protein [Candidatus Angelobacter sp.]